MSTDSRNDDDKDSKADRINPNIRKRGHGDKTNTRHVRCRASCKGDFDQFFYNTPDSKLLTILIIITIILVCFFLYLFKYVTMEWNLNDSTNGAVGVYLSIVGVPVGVVLSFIVATTWASFSDAQAKENAEATKLLLLYDLLAAMPGAEDIQRKIKVYTAFVISDEFPLMEQGIQSEEGLLMITDIGDSIYALDAETNRDAVLYEEAIEMFQEVMSLRISRMGYAVYGIAPELWWVLILGVIIVIVMSFFMYSQSLTLQMILTAMAAAVLVSLLFLIVALNYAYRGDFGLDSLPFQIALVNMVPDDDRGDDKKRQRRRKHKNNDKKKSSTSTAETTSSVSQSSTTNETEASS